MRGRGGRVEGGEKGKGFPQNEYSPPRSYQHKPASVLGKCTYIGIYARR